MKREQAMHVLHLVTSPQPESMSRRLGREIVAGIRDANADVTVDEWNLWAEPLASFGPEGVAAKMAVIGGGEPDESSAAAWNAAITAFERFAAADVVVVGAPMWNGGVPWVLKLLIDTITQPGKLFGFDPETGYQGLLGGRRAVVAYTSAVYSDGADPRFGVDFHSTYLEWWLDFAGIDLVDSVRLQPTFGGDLADRTAVAITSARDAGRRAGLSVAAAADRAA
jgi:FMN-dependent NADH-azoreductase